MPFSLVIHGGADPKSGIDYARHAEHMAQLIEYGKNELQNGSSALDTTTSVVRELEKSGLYIAGKGSSPNQDGRFELDASVMDGSLGRAGAVAAIEDVVHPVEAARLLLEEGQNVLLAGSGARKFAKARDLDLIGDPKQYYSPVENLSGAAHRMTSESHGTVGAVALDLDGHLAAATSAGGSLNRRPGRVGDSPLIGAGTWADRNVAVSCTGFGEYFVRVSAANQVASRVRFEGVSLETACVSTLGEVTDIGGRGGLIAVDNLGNLTMVYNSRGMKRAWVSDRNDPEVRVFDKEGVTVVR